MKYYLAIIKSNYGDLLNKKGEHSVRNAEVGGS